MTKLAKSDCGRVVSVNRAMMHCTRRGRFLMEPQAADGMYSTYGWRVGWGLENIVLEPLGKAGETACDPQNAMRSPGAVLDVTATLSSAMVPAMATTTGRWKSVPACLLCADELYARMKPMRTRHVCFDTRASHAEPEHDTEKDRPSARAIRYTTRTVQGGAGVIHREEELLRVSKPSRRLTNKDHDAPTSLGEVEQLGLRRAEPEALDDDV